MKLTAKGRYAVMAMADLALQGEGTVVSLSDIATRQNISLSFLEQLFGKMRRAGLVDSVRGPAGGYRLAQDLNTIPVSGIISAVDEEVKAHGCTPEARVACTGIGSRCLTHDLWGALESHIEDFLASVSLADVIEGRMSTPELEAAE